VTAQLVDSCELGDDASCNGTPNEGCACVGDTPCGIDVGACQVGVSRCVNGAPGACENETRPIARDCRSPFDNDCNGTLDNAIDATCQCAEGSTRACDLHPGFDGRGICRAGSQRCVFAAGNVASAFGSCTGSVGPAARNCSSMQDNDCNGVADNVIDDTCQCRPGDQRACGAEAGSFGCRQGTQVCQGTGGRSAFGPCTFAPVTNGTTCNDENPLTINDRCQTGRCVGSTATCGNGVVEESEACDDGNSSNLDACTNTCAVARCGDRFVQPGRGETCDDGNTVSGDGCSRACVAGRAPRGAAAFAATHLCAVLPSGAVSCWGLNLNGQLGNGISATSDLVGPRPVFGISNAVDVAVMGNSTCALLRDQTVACWGSGFDSAQPTAIAGVSNVTQIAAGMDQFCAWRAPGQVRCWGTDSVVTTPWGAEALVQVARGDRHSCGLREDGQLLCYGGNTVGEQGRGVIDGLAFSIPSRATVFGAISEVAAGYRSTCVRLRSGGTVQCVGAGGTAGSTLALPDGNVQPITVVNLPNAVKLAAGEQHMCALSADDTVRCWGTGLAVGTGSDSGSATPVTVALPGPAIDVGAGSFTSCALLTDSSVRCWGSYARVTASAPQVSASATPSLVDLQ
jgi:cysteine-rich repeat protein